MTKTFGLSRKKSTRYVLMGRYAARERWPTINAYMLPRVCYVYIDTTEVYYNNYVIEGKLGKED
jgi:hypothetical protein